MSAEGNRTLEGRKSLRRFGLKSFRPNRPADICRRLSLSTLCRAAKCSAPSAATSPRFPARCRAASGYRDPSSNLGTQLRRIVLKAGLTPWPKLWQNRSTELAVDYPGHVAAHFLAHSVLFAQKHYWQVTDQDYDRASEAVQDPVQQGPAMRRIGQNTELTTNAKPLASQGVANFCDIVYTYSDPRIELSSNHFARGRFSQLLCN